MYAIKRGWKADSKLQVSSLHSEVKAKSSPRFANEVPVESFATKSKIRQPRHLSHSQQGVYELRSRRNTKCQFSKTTKSITRKRA